MDAILTELLDISFLVHIVGRDHIKVVLVRNARSRFRLYVDHQRPQH